MTQQYFNYVPNFEYVDRTPNTNSVSNYIQVKNLFKRTKLREDIFQDLAYFTKYTIVGDDRPDNVAEKVYDDPNLDWLVLLSNNILNIETEWPLTQEGFEKYLTYKYGDNQTIYSVRHYETREIRDSLKRIIIPAGLEVPSDYSVTYFDSGLGQSITTSSVSEITNYQYELNIQNQRRNIFLLKEFYLGLIIDDLETIMPYPEGSSQYVSDSLVRGDNIKLYE